MRCLRDAFACVPATKMYLFETLRARRNILDVKSTLIVFHAIFWSECLVFATQSQAVRMSVISMRSTQQIVNNWKLKAVESVGAKMTGPSHVNECSWMNEWNDSDTVFFCARGEKERRRSRYALKHI